MSNRCGPRIMTAVGLTITLGLVAACGGGPAPYSYASFCKLATTTNQGRTEAQINAYYGQLKKVAPKSLVGDVTTLGAEWKSVGMSLGSAVSGNVTSITRPPEVIKAAKDVMNVVSKQCHFSGGVYVVDPQAGLG